MESRAIFSVGMGFGMGFYIGILLWPLLNCLYRIHVLFVDLPETLTVAHMDLNDEQYHHTLRFSRVHRGTVLSRGQGKPAGFFSLRVL